MPLRPARDESSETHQTYLHCLPSGVARSFLVCLPACLSYRQPFGFQCFRMSRTFRLRGSPLIPMAKFGIPSLTTKKNFKKYLISLIIKHLQRGIFAVKRFNRPCAALGGLCSGGSIRTCARMHVCTQAHTTTGYLLKRFVLGSRHPGGIFVLLRTRYAKIKRFNRLYYVSCM